MSKKIISWQQYFMGVAKLSAYRSKDPNTQVGACIVSPENKIVGVGYNGLPWGCEDDQFPWAAREGDLYDTKNISATAKNAVIDEILNHPEIDFYYLLGNHDGDSLLSAFSEMPDNLKLFNNSWTDYKVENTKIHIIGIEISEENNSTMYDALTLNPNDFNIVVLHGQEAIHKSRDKNVKISLRELKNKNIDLKTGILISVYGILGAIIGANIAIKVNVKILKKAFGIFLAIIAIHEIYTSIKLYKKEKVRDNNNE